MLICKIRRGTLKMKGITKKILVTILVLVLLLACCSSVLAESVQPRWKELSTLIVNIQRKNGLFSNTNVYVDAASWQALNTINITLTVQKWNGSAYVNTSYSWSTSGKGGATIDKNISLDSGNYIAHAVVTVYNSSGNYVETVTQDSSEIII